MNFLNKLFLFPAVLLALGSCSKKPDIENTATVRMAGDWFTQYFQDGAAVTEHHKILTYNTSDPASGQIWVEDHDVWPFKSKLDIDYPTLSFKAMASAANTEVTGETVKVYEGKVIPGAGRSKSGVSVDSIYLKLEFSDDPGVVYEIRGHHRTGFFEDEY